MTDIKTIGVLGAGQMGGGIAQVASAAGYDVLQHHEELGLDTYAVWSASLETDRGLSSGVEPRTYSASSSVGIFSANSPNQRL